MNQAMVTLLKKNVYRDKTAHTFILLRDYNLSKHSVHFVIKKITEQIGLEMSGFQVNIFLISSQNVVGTH